jgi:hypothetical protein
MKQTHTIGKAATSALPPTIFAGVGLVTFGAFDVFRHGSPPVVMAIICLGLAAVIFLTYFILGIAGYRVSADESVRAPWPYAWAVALAAVAVAGALGYLVASDRP